MYAEPVEPIKPPAKAAKSAEKGKGKTGKSKKGKSKKGKSKKAQMLFGPLVFNPYRLYLPYFSLADGTRMVNPDESEWKRIVPARGVIRFRFASTSVGPSHMLDKQSVAKIVEIFQDAEKLHAQRMEALDVLLGTYSSIRMQQVETILDAVPVDFDNKLRERDLVLSRSALVVRCFHRLVETDQARDLLLLLDEESRRLASKSLGSTVFSFTRNNPSGCYHLNLEVDTERELCLRLVESYNEQRVRLKQLERDNASRRAGDASRLTPQRIWRNLRINNKPVVFESSWRVPHTGRLQVDFVCLNKPPPGALAMANKDFRIWKEEVLTPLEDREDEVVAAIRLQSNISFFSCEQVMILLSGLSHAAMRVETCVIAFSRNIDHQNYKYLLEYLTGSEVQLLQSRLGLVNLWNESAATGFYQLDLSQVQTVMCQLFSCKVMQLVYHF